MKPVLLVAAALTAALVPPCSAQTANGGPTTAAPPVLPGTPRPVTRTAPSVGAKRPGALAAGRDASQLPKPTAAEIAERKKLDHDMRICIGC